MLSAAPVQVQRSNTDMMEQDKKANNDFVPVYKRTVQVIVISIVIFFAPLSFTYFFDETHTSNLSDKVLAILVNPEFAYGEGSATLSDTNGGQMRIFLRNLTAMVSHREFMVLNYAFMLSAPVLRVAWVILGQLWGETKYIINLYSSIFSGPFLVAASIFYLRQQHVRPSSSLLISSKFRLAAIASGLLGLLFQITKGPSFNGGPYPKAFLLALGPQLACYILLFVTLARAAKRRGDMGSYTAWITYQNGLISAPMWSVLSLYVARDILRCSEESLWMITVREGFSQGLFSSFVIYVLATSKLANARPHTVKAD